MKHSTLFFILIGVYVIVGYFTSKEYGQYTALVGKDINGVWDEAVKTEYKLRLDASDMGFTFKVKSIPNHLILFTGIEEGASPERFIPYPHEIQKETSVIDAKLMEESFLLKRFPVNKEILDSLFRKGLEDRKITGVPQVSVVVDSGNPDLRKEAVLNSSTFYTRVHTQGVHPVVKLQGQIDYSKWSVLRRMDTAWMAWSGVLLLSLVLFVVKRKSQEVQFVNIEMPNPVPLALPLPEHPELAYKWSEREDGNFYMEDMKEEIYFNTVDGIVYDKRSQKKVKLTPQLSNLFVLFLKAEEHRVPVKDIVKALWPEDKNWEQDTKKVSQRINKLKEGLLQVLDVDLNKPKSAYIFRSWPKKEEKGDSI